MNWNPWSKPPKTELQLAEARYTALSNERRMTEISRGLQYEASRLEQLKSEGEAFYAPQPAPTATPPSMRIGIPVYEEDPITGYPFVPKMHYEQVRFEQDPLFGWRVDPMSPFSSWDPMTVGVNGFPREMLPQLPTTLRTQIAQDAVRFQSRIWFETLPQLSGLISHLRNYVVGSGMVIDVVSDTDDELAEAVSAYLDEFACYKQNRLHKRVWDSVLNIYRDGEDSLRLLPGPEYPTLHPIDTSWIRGPHCEMTGPWSMGVLTSWPRDFEDVKAYHVWWPDNTHEDVAPTQMFLAKLDTTGPNVKRGVPLAYRMRKQLPQLEKLLECTALGEAARQSIAYIQQYQMADRTAVQGTINARIAAPSWQTNSNEHTCGAPITPGGVVHINSGQEYKEPPQGYGASGSAVYRMICEAIANAATVPIWMVTGTADSENYASALVSESPVVKNIQHVQQIITDYFHEILEACLNMAIAQGKFPSNTLEICRIHCELPSPIAHDKKAENDVLMQLLGASIISPQHVAKRNDLDLAEELDLIHMAKAMGWEDAQEKAEALASAKTPADTQHEQDTGEGHWVTINGAHVFIKGGGAAATSAIPASGPHGLMPPGAHKCTVEAAVARFGTGNPQRVRLGKRLTKWAGLAKECGIKKMLVDGSFVEGKPNPGDVDAVMMLPGSFSEQVFAKKPAALELGHILLNRMHQPGGMIGKALGITKPNKDLFAVQSQASWDFFTKFFGLTREDKPKGLLEIQL